jgi:hypothetical protein
VKRLAKQQTADALAARTTEVAIWLARSPEAQQTADALAARTMQVAVRAEAA